MKIQWEEENKLSPESKRDYNKVFDLIDRYTKKLSQEETTNIPGTQPTSRQSVRVCENSADPTSDTHIYENNCSEVKWCHLEDSIDYQHLLEMDSQYAEIVKQKYILTEKFDLTPKIITLLAKLNSFSANGRYLLFGLRGCIIKDENYISKLSDLKNNIVVSKLTSERWKDIFHADDSAIEQLFVSKIEVAHTLPDHKNLNCIIGICDLQQNKILLLRASTVPTENFVKKACQKQMKVNLLPTGLYKYRKGHHSSGDTIIPNALRENGRVNVLRTIGNAVFTDLDIWDLYTNPADNIHASRKDITTSFSSAGCNVILGSAKRTENTVVHKKDWAIFKHVLAKKVLNDSTTEYMLLTGMEAYILSTILSKSLSLEDKLKAVNSLKRIRIGSEGSHVEQVQKKLDEYLGRNGKLIKSMNKNRDLSSMVIASRLTNIIESGLKINGNYDGKFFTKSSSVYILWQKFIRNDGRLKKYAADGIITPNDFVNMELQSSLWADPVSISDINP